MRQARCTRPDISISFAVHKLTRRTHAPTTADWALRVRVVKYIKCTKRLKLYLGGEVCTNRREVNLEVFLDADFAADDETRKSISGTAFILNGIPINWSYSFRCVFISQWSLSKIFPLKDCKLDRRSLQCSGSMMY